MSLFDKISDFVGASMDNALQWGAGVYERMGAEDENAALGAYSEILVTYPNATVVANGGGLIVNGKAYNRVATRENACQPDWSKAGGLSPTAAEWDGYSDV